MSICIIKSMACLKIMYGVEQALRELLGRVAEDYGLEYSELEARYFQDGEHVPAESIASSPPPKAAKAPAAAKAGGELCTGVTTKGAPCKKRAVAGGCLCSVHAKTAGGPLKAPKEKKKEAPKKVTATAEDAVSEASPVKVKKAKKAKGDSDAAVHSHGVVEGVVEGCEGCEVHGPVMGSPEYAVRGSVRSRMVELLERVKVMEEAEVEEEEEAE